MAEDPLLASVNEIHALMDELKASDDKQRRLEKELHLERSARERDAAHYRKKDHQHSLEILELTKQAEDAKTAAKKSRARKIATTRDSRLGASSSGIRSRQLEAKLAEAETRAKQWKEAAEKAEERLRHMEERAEGEASRAAAAQATVRAAEERAQLAMARAESSSKGLVASVREVAAMKIQLMEGPFSIWQPGSLARTLNHLLYMPPGTEGSQHSSPPDPQCTGVVRSRVHLERVADGSWAAVMAAMASLRREVSRLRVDREAAETGFAQVLSAALGEDPQGCVEAILAARREAAALRHEVGALTERLAELAAKGVAAPGSESDNSAGKGGEAAEETSGVERLEGEECTQVLEVLAGLWEEIESARSKAAELQVWSRPPCLWCVEGGGGPFLWD